ncbi:MAG: methyltransferase domain-containing protein [Gemmatimonadaceae bacterium]
MHTSDSNVAELTQLLDEAAAKLESDSWIAGLSDRKRKESQFHDWCRDRALVTEAQSEQGESPHANKKYYDTRDVSWSFTQNWIKKHAKGKVFLDYCCGEGGVTLLGAEAGASLAIGIDISPLSIDICRRTAEERGMTKNTRFVVGDCERTGLPDNSVDSIIALGVLHHLDLSYAFPEIRRILKPGGRLHAMEALAYNPAIAIYRRLTPGLRTEWERHHILSLKEMRFAKHFFSVENVRYFHLTSVLTTPLRKTPVFKSALKVANALDNVLLRIPPICYMAWSFSFELVKRPGDRV